MMKRICSLPFIIETIIFSIGLADISIKYSLMKINASINSTWLIGNYKISSKLKCFAQCNSMPDCYSVAFSENSRSANNCACYSIEFATNESIVVQDTYLYSKLQQTQQQQQQCKMNILISFFLF